MIKNLTPHAVALFATEQLPENPEFYRTSGGWLRVGRMGQFGDVLPIGYTQWDPEPVPARVSEERGDRVPLLVSEVEDYGDGHGPVAALRYVPVRSVKYGTIIGLPGYRDGDFYIVSLPVVHAARESGRRTDDLLTPGELIRDPKGEIAGCISFYRW